MNHRDRIRPYDLQDMDLLRAPAGQPGITVFVPDTTAIVLGKGSDPEKAVKWDRLADDPVDVYQRPSGGESVIISENTVIIAIVINGEKLRNPSIYFESFNSALIKALKTLGIRELNQRGFSDICIGEKKILGSSIYRSGETVFYHAVLNVSEPVATMEKYLQHPEREPEYRKKRLHFDFVTSLHAEGYAIGIETLQNAILDELNRLAPR